MIDILYLAAIVLCGSGLFYFGMRHERACARLRAPATRRQLERVARHNRADPRLVQAETRGPRR